MEVALVPKSSEMVRVDVTAGQIDEYLVSFGLADKLNQQERKQFIEVAMAFNLNPFKREVYCIPYGTGEKRKLSIITGYETYLKRAERTGRLAGWKAWTEGSYKVVSKTKSGYKGEYEVKVPAGDLRAIVEIHIVGWQSPFVHEVYLDEYAQENDMWASKPRTMLKKVAIAQGFRMAFPDDMGGMPYTSDELPPEMTSMRTVTHEPQAITHTEPLKSDSAVAALYQAFRDYINSGLLNEEAEKALQAAMDSGDTRIKHLEKMLARAKQIHDEAITGRAEE